MKILLSNDWHLSSTGPSTRVDDWHATVERKLDFVEQVAKDERVDAIGIAGDLFNKETLAFASGTYAPMTATTDRFYRWSRRWPLLVIPGNHDLKHNNIDLLAQTPFGVLLAAKILTPVWEKPFIHADGSWVGGMPYRVEPEMFDRWKTVQPGWPGIMLLHCYGGLSGGAYHGETVWAYPALAQQLPNVVAFCLGHDHRDLGVERLGEQAFIQLGSLFRGTRSDDQVTRQPKIAVVETVLAQPLFGKGPSCTVKAFDVPIEPGRLVFSEKKTHVEEGLATIEGYVNELAAITKLPDGVDSAMVDTLTDIPDAVRLKAKDYLARAGGAQ